MAKAFDSITRMLLESHPADWLSLVGLGRGLTALVVDSDVSTITAEVDKVLRVDGPEPFLVHVEIQAYYDTTLPRRLLRYNALLNIRHDLPVLSVAVLLMREADGTAIDGTLELRSPDGRCRVDFQYPVVRIWEQSAADRAAWPGTLPLAALAARTPEELKAVAIPALTAFREPLTQGQRELRAALYFLVGRRFSDTLADEIFGGDPSMEESVTYQKVVQKGRVEEGRRIVTRQATKRFGPPSEALLARLDAIRDTDRLEDLADRVLTATGWDDLLAEPRPADESPPR